MIISIKAIVLIIAMLGLFFDFWPALPKKEPVAIVQTIDNVYAAMVDAPNSDARDDIGEAHKEEQKTQRLESDNATRTETYAVAQEHKTERYKNTNSTILWGFIGLLTAVSLPKDIKRVCCETN